jgi:hypothetical protein
MKKTLGLSTNKEIRAYYRSNNILYFGSRLPENVIVRFGVIRGNKDAAIVDSWGNGPDKFVEITIDRRLRGMACVVAWHIIHEQVHLDNPRLSHGPGFDKRMLELARAGIFNGIW